MTIWKLDVDRVRLVGAGSSRPVAGELHALIERAVRAALETTPLPTGRAMRASLRVDVPSLAGGAAIARAVATGVSRAMGGRERG